jgi:hypothetical protein
MINKLPKNLYEELSNRAVDVIGREKILNLLPEQENTLDKFLDEMLEEYGSVDKITDEMIIGQYEMMLIFMPTELVLAYHHVDGENIK